MYCQETLNKVCTYFFFIFKKKKIKHGELLAVVACHQMFSQKKVRKKICLQNSEIQRARLHSAEAEILHLLKALWNIIKNNQI